MYPKKQVLRAVLAVVLLGLTGCSGGDGIAALDRAATPEDRLPDYVSTGNLDVASVRQVVEHDGVDYFISEPQEGNGFCVIRTPARDETAWMSGCSSTAAPLEIHYPGRTSGATTLVTDGYSSDRLEDDGWTRIHDNLFIR